MLGLAERLVVNSEQPNQTDMLDALAYAGLVLVSFELVRSLIVRPIKDFYQGITFGPEMPFVSYENDVLSRHKNEFEACLLYLKDFMQAIDAADVEAIQALRRHRNDLAHNLPERLEYLDVPSYAELLKASDKALFKLSNHNAYIEIGGDPKVQALDIDWSLAEGHEYVQFKTVLSRVQRLRVLLA